MKEEIIPRSDGAEVKRAVGVVKAPPQQSTEFLSRGRPCLGLGPARAVVVRLPPLRVAQGIELAHFLLEFARAAD